MPLLQKFRTCAVSVLLALPQLDGLPIKGDLPSSHLIAETGDPAANADTQEDSNLPIAECKRLQYTALRIGKSA